MSSNGEYQVDPGAVRAVAGTITAEILRAYTMLQSIRSMAQPEFGPVGGAAAAATRDLREQLERSLETTLERLNTVNLLVSQAADAYSNLDSVAAHSFRRAR
jgi:hypothetical protein